MHPLIEFSTACILRQVNFPEYNTHMRRLILLFLLVAWVSACAEASPIPPTRPATQLSGELTPFVSSTPSRTSTLLPPAATIALTPIPTATPFTHMIERGDTMLGIAIRYGLTLEQLQAANPGVDPGFLVIGNALIIPIEGLASNEIPQPTPLPVPWTAPRCYASADDGLWCFIVVTNNQSNAIENISAWISLYDEQGNLLSGRAAVPPLNKLPSAASMPLVAFFDAPLPGEPQPQGQLLTALAVEDVNARYLDAEVRLGSVEIAEDGTSAAVQGQVLVPEGSSPSTVWIVLTAYDDGGEVVGMRKFDLGTPCGTPPAPAASSTPQPTPGTGTPAFTPTTSATPAPLTVCTPFEYAVYSLGPGVGGGAAIEIN
jgi:LysM repeat protein